MFFAISSSEFQEACALAQSDRISTFANPETINQFIEDKGLYPCHLCCQSSSAVSFITIIHTGKSLSEALIFASTNPQYDDRSFIELQVQCMKILSSNLGRTC